MSATGYTVRTRANDEIDHTDRWYATEHEAQAVFDKLKERAEDFAVLAMIEGNPNSVDIEDNVALS